MMVTLCTTASLLLLGSWLSLLEPMDLYFSLPILVDFGPGDLGSSSLLTCLEALIQNQKWGGDSVHVSFL